MKAQCPRLADLEAHEIMSTDLILIPLHMSVGRAAHLLHQASVSGAPVIDSSQRCVGVLSSSDFVTWADNGGDSGLHPRPNQQAMHCAWQVPQAPEAGTETVKDLMTPNPVMAGRHTPVTALARMMVDAHIHRVVVIDEELKPVGIVSSTDILAAIAREGDREGGTWAE